MKSPFWAIVALGSNLGERAQNVKAAMEELQKLSAKPVVKSSLWETSPVDCPPGSLPFINAVIAFEPQPGETPRTLLQKLFDLEVAFGRKPKEVLNEPRPLDLDLIAFGPEMLSNPDLTLPHPRAFGRGFVLYPLSEIAPNLVLPGQMKTVEQLLVELPPGQPVRRLSSAE